MRWSLTPAQSRRGRQDRPFWGCRLWGAAPERLSGGWHVGVRALEAGTLQLC